MMTDKPPTTFSTFDGRVSATTTYLGLWASGHTEVRRSALRAVAAMHRYAAYFVFARPRAHIFQGQADWLQGRRTAALVHWKRALTAAESLGFRYDSALAHLELGHLDEARELFERCGVAAGQVEVVAARNLVDRT